MTVPVRSILILLLIALLIAPRPATAEGKARVEFERDVQPILASRCYECHGPAKQKGQLRLDSKAIAFKGGTSDVPAITPGDGVKSHLVQRLLGQGDEDRMPLKREPLTAEQIQTIKTWIDQGADWPDRLSVQDATIDVHWSFVKPERPELPAVSDPGWVKNPIDRFVMARLDKEGLKPSPAADRYTLIRRLSLDLTGLPPTEAQVNSFVYDKSPRAYEDAVERLLASPHYGERWARVWLDVARYADTNGYEKDRSRVIWPYRDWVIRALNQDLPFDRFTIDQIAGDMLPVPSGAEGPSATPDQIIATGFHRNTMTNEEGGIDVEEFRFKNVVDRVHTTATAWLGLTVQCAQCHNHKYDPISQREYYGFFAMLNNADEPHEYRIPDPAVAARRAGIERQIAQLESGLEARFMAGAGDAFEWTPLTPSDGKASSGAVLTKQSDDSLLASGPVPKTDSYAVTFRTDLTGIGALRLEALTDPSLTSNGPGRTGANNGNYVITDVKVSAAPAAGGEPEPVTIASAEADVNQAIFPVNACIDGDPATGWAVDDGTGRINQNHAATLRFKEPVGFDGGTLITVTIEQAYANHTLGKFRISAGRATAKTGNQGQGRLRERLAEWTKQASEKAGRWTPVAPLKVTSQKGATMEVLDDASVLVSGDWPNFDTYEVELETDLKSVSALRLEVLPHESLPDGGPGRAPLFSVGDFFLSEVSLGSLPPASSLQRGREEPLTPIRIARATSSAGDAGNALDGKLDTGWSIGASTAKPARAVFVTESPIAVDADGRTRLKLTLVQQYIHQMTIGRFRVWVTTDPKPPDASDLPPDVEQALVTESEKRSPAQHDLLKRHFLSIAPELAPVHQQIASLRQSMPMFPTTLVMQERRPQHARVTRVHHRGEFLHPRQPVQPGVPKVLHPLPKDAKPDRLALAHWLVANDNPLTARVTVNRAWTAFFGRGIVSTVEDWGTMGAAPSHAELLDWLATEFQFPSTDSGQATRWSQKALHRLIVTSATYRQSSNVSPDLLTRDPDNALLARGPRVRVDAETVRDIALTASGLLSRTIGGPSVYPPQPEGISDLSWGGGSWPTSTGPDRFRRGLYAFLKRTSPYPGMTVFDGTTADVACMRRLRSNTPLQALTLLNDRVFLEASQGLARRVMTEGPPDTIGRARFAFRQCTSREPDALELDRIVAFHGRQLARFASKDADAAAVATSEAVPAPPGFDLNELAAWTTVTRAMLNLDETITKP